MYKRWMSLVLLVVLLLGMLAGCGRPETPTNTESGNAAELDGSPETIESGDSGTRKYVDMDGTEVELPAEVKTVVDVWAANNQVLVLLGVSDRLVGTTSGVQDVAWMQKLNPNITNIPSLIENDEINKEEMLKANPDVIIVNERDVEGTRSTGIPTVNLHFSDFDGLKEMIMKTAEIFGEEQMEIAKEFNDYFQANRDKLAAVAKDIPDDEKKVVLYVRSGDAGKIMTDGKETMASEWIESIGGINAASAAGIESFGKDMSIEEILTQNPDVIIVQDSANAVAFRDEIFKNENWKEITAIKERQVFINPNGVFYWDRYSAEEAMQILWAATVVYPEKYADIDIVQETRDFYKNFFYYDLTIEEANEILKVAENKDI